MKETVLFNDLGKDQAYKEIWDLQESLLQQNVQIKSEKRPISAHTYNSSASGIDPATATANSQPSTVNFNSAEVQQVTTLNHLLFVEHSPVYTLGKSGNISHILIGEEERIEKGIEFFKINRGGDITFHGPGQLTGYPILDLDKFKTDLGWFLRSLEEVVILTLTEYGLKGERSKGETGVWIEPDIKGKERKICAMGIRCSRWITMHGFALNVNTDLTYFDYIIPCGIQNKRVTSLKKELGYHLPIEQVKQCVKKNFEKVFDVKCES
jgi:lipoyl(octanoyl) transferase